MSQGCRAQFQRSTAAARFLPALFPNQIKVTGTNTFKKSALRDFPLRSFSRLRTIGSLPSLEQTAVSESSGPRLSTFRTPV